MGLSRVTPPQGEVLSLAELKRHLRVDHDAEDELIMSMLAASVSHLEGDGIGAGWFGRVLLPQVWEMTLDAFPARVIQLPMSGVTEIVSITYTDTDGEAQTSDAAQYRLLSDRLRPEIVPAYGAAWPVARDEEAAITVRFRCGYVGEENDSPPGPNGVPVAAKQAIKLMVGHWYANRETVNVGNIVSEMPWAARALLTPLRGWIA